MSNTNVLETSWGCVIFFSIHAGTNTEIQSFRNTGTMAWTISFFFSLFLILVAIVFSLLWYPSVWESNNSTTPFSTMSRSISLWLLNSFSYLYVAPLYLTSAETDSNPLCASWTRFFPEQNHLRCSCINYFSASFQLSRLWGWGQNKGHLHSFVND